MTKQIQISALSNGIRTAFLPYKSDVAFAGLIIPVGSAHENSDEEGVSHYIEHLLFKGTAKRSSAKVINCLEELGGELNAYTTKEETVIYAAFPLKYYRKAVNLICEIAFSSTFKEKEIENERGVILDEIFSYKDTPSENIYDEFEEIIFKDSPYGHNILGTEESVKALGRDKIMEFWKRNYFSDKNQFFFMGDLKPKVIIEMLEENTAPFSFNEEAPILPESKSSYTKQNIKLNEETYQLHYILGKRGYDMKHPDRLALVLLNNILGGPSMNSRLNMNLREKHGIAYNIDSIFTPLSYDGIFSIYLGTDKENLAKSKKLVKRELQKFIDAPLSDAQLNKAKTQFIGQIAIGRENKENQFLDFGKQVHYYGNYASMEYIQKQLDGLTAQQLQTVAKDVFNWDDFSSLTIM